MLEDIEDLLILFDDEEAKKIILSSYFLSQEKNNELSDSVFEKLLFLKIMYPEISIQINRNSSALSNYNYDENTIYLNGTFDEITFFHELTHLFSRQQFNFAIPMEYDNFKKEFLLSKNNHSLLFSFVELCKSKKQEILNTSQIDFVQNNNYIKNNNEVITCLPNINEFSVISHLEDIVDALVSGKSHDLGLYYEIDSNHIGQKATRSAGHGCKYYMVPGAEFEEIIANYQAINLIDPQNELFNILKSILGDDFISFLDNRCQQMNSSKITIENNNNIRK